ncbi:MAG TPA: autotransporter domain-containing protein [Acidiphilium sp.]|nr:MAG: autotransporter outer membrane beta-barrel domain-containing protein [Acidiphilium sp. 21-60-14]OYV90981.1 MAG: autotransporter outer membrane beta-barrel domain-containing protein [Acidiphilium sp. 37-60-79]HQT88596.1 autotransporter domain-containing protein [Acidiphilium sp.]HQU24530.1 autotransporter domain-containing protein [Acidiphilium sp.]
MRLQKNAILRNLLCGSAVAAMIAAGAPLARAGGSGGNFYAFGDSLVDNGNIPRLTGIPFPASPPYYQHEFSNGPVWAQYLPQLTGLGFQPSNDYGVGGAFTGPLVIGGTTYNNISNVEGFPAPLPSFLGEVQSFAAAGGHFGPGDVVGIWVGANNYFVAAGAVQANPAAATQIITGAVTTAVTQTVQGIEELSSLGGRTFIVQTLPPLGATPLFNTNPLAAFVANSISTAHDAALTGAIATLHNQAGLNIILVNQTQLFSEVAANPGAYGYTNITQACRLSANCLGQPLSVQNQYLYWGHVHPTTRTHFLIAQYSASALQGFQGLAVPAELLQRGATAFSDTISARMDALRGGASGLSVNLPGGPILADAAAGDVGPMGAMPMAGHRLSVFVTGNYQAGYRNDQPTSLGFHDQIGTVAAGADYRFTPHAAVGGAVGYADETANVSGGATVKANAYQLAAYAMFDTRHFFLNAQADYGIDNFSQLSRPGVLGPLTAKPTGHTFSLVAQAGLVKHFGAMAIGPVVGVDYTEANVNAYTEQGDAVLTMAVQSQSLTRTIGSAGFAASTTVALGGLVLQPHASILGEAELDGSNGGFSSVFTDEPLVGLTTTYTNPAKAWGVASLGVSTVVAGRMSVTLGLASTFAKSDGAQRMVTAGLRYRF